MDASIRHSLLNGDTIPLREMTPGDWLTIINRLLDELDKAARHMRFPQNVVQHVIELQRSHPGVLLPLSTAVMVEGQRLKGNPRFALLGTTIYGSWDYVALAYDSAAELRVIHVRWSPVDAAGDVVQVQPLYDYDSWSGDRLEEILASGPLDGSGCNTLARDVVQALLKLIEDNVALKAKNFETFRRTSARMAGIAGVLGE